MWFHYRLYGLTIISERPLPLLRPEPDEDRPVDVTIRFGVVRTPDLPVLGESRGLTVYQDGSGLWLSGTGARFLIADGSSILADVPADMSGAGMHTCLMGPAMAWLLHLRDRPPLHACVIAIGVRAVALVGNSGVGKSTLARALLARGHGLVTDDQAVIETNPALVHPGYPAIKLWADSARLHGDETPETLRVLPDVDKFHRPFPDQFRETPLPLVLTVILRRAPALTAPDVVRTTPMQAAALLQHFLYRAKEGRLLNRGRAGFDWTIALSREMPVIVLRRPDNLDMLNCLCDEVEGLVDTAMPL
ncbi:HPr Serine kinase C-terminal domain-containing protein [Methylobacterium sp. 174MFSha1.1]|uniref:hypothetical protein n=1 Tax=Methylobacterium sp. 174MFSha1.1 TaxID=1502749 RepID=UPI0008E87502|nr:hypothetical protein [Methylobacterium sp. 174MFSha1.1]SFV08892.1 HPr Serine kinase C-terminal domain-containing protein [Methylobacterium sp. 174MFSha1.1]